MATVNKMLQELKQITFNEAVRKVHENYGIYGQFTVSGNTVEDFELIPRTDRGYDLEDMNNMRTDIDFLSEQIKAECE